MIFNHLGEHMMDTFWTAPENLPFLISLGLFFGLSFIQGISFILGMSLDQSVDQWMGVGNADLDLGVDVDLEMADGIDAADGAGGLWGAMDWLNAGKIPLLFLILTFLGCYALIGYLLQLILFQSIGKPGPVWIMGLVVLPVCLPFSRWFSMGLGKILPKDETSAVSRDSFIGQAAVITLGIARVGSPAQAKLKDTFGQTHYVMVEPDEAEETFRAGDRVILVRFSQNGSGFLATPDPFDSAE